MSRFSLSAIHPLNSCETSVTLFTLSLVVSFLSYTPNEKVVCDCCAGSGAFILPMGVLTSKEEKECRKFLIEKGWLQAAISLPEKMFESTSVATCILVLDKRKTSKDVMLINAEEMKSVELREQRGEGDNSNFLNIFVFSRLRL